MASHGRSFDGLLNKTRTQIVSFNTAESVRLEVPPPHCYVVCVAISAIQDSRPDYGRRSKRLKVRVPVIVRTQTADKKPVSEKAEALVVNAHGGLILLATKVSTNDMILIANPKTEEELLCRVTCLGPSFMGKTEVGIEFIKPAPRFWGVSSPPEDWKPQSFKGDAGKKRRSVEEVESRSKR